MATANPVLAYTATLLAGSAIAAGNSLTVTVNITQGWEVQVPVNIRYATASLDTGVFAYPSSDGGASFDNQPIVAFAIPAVHIVNSRGSVRLSTGMYAIEIRSSSLSITIQVLTQQVVTAING
jgi:hypothetical protein